MTDIEKLEKVRAEIERVKKNQEGVFTSYTDGKFDLCEHLLSFIDSMQEEPKDCMYSKDNYTDEDRKVLCDGCEEKCKYDKSDDFTKALAECIHNAQCNVVDPMVFAEIWKDELIKLSKCEEPVSEDLEEAANNAVIALVPSFGQKYSDGSYVSSCRDSFKREELIELFKAGVNWQKENLWKPADGNDLPEIDREVIALLDDGKVVFAHRPPEYWDGKNIVTGKVTRNYPKTYGKGGWNIPNVRWWLDCLMPKEIEL